MRSEEIFVAGKPGLSLRLVREEDWRALGEIMADFARSPFARFDVPKDTDEAALKSRISRWAAANRTGDEHLFFLSLFQGKPIGLFPLISGRERAKRPMKSAIVFILRRREKAMPQRVSGLFSRSWKIPVAPRFFLRAPHLKIFRPFICSRRCPF